MFTTAVPRKELSQRERTTALAAIAMAKSKHKHVGIRPKKERTTEKKTSGTSVVTSGHRGKALDAALWKAGEAWPADSVWEVFGANDFADFPTEAHCDDAFGDGCFIDPYVYGEFQTTDAPSCLDQ